MPHTTFAALAATIALCFAAHAAPTTTHAAPTTTQAAPTTTWEADTATDAPAEPTCTTYDVPETDDGYATAQALRADGWFGDTADHAERLYSPACPRTATSA